MRLPEDERQFAANREAQLREWWRLRRDGFENLSREDLIDMSLGLMPAAWSSAEWLAKCSPTAAEQIADMLARAKAAGDAAEIADCRRWLKYAKAHPVPEHHPTKPAPSPAADTARTRRGKPKIVK
jgi:hypothetical protein